MKARLALLAALLLVGNLFAAEEKAELAPEVYDELRKTLREGPDSAARLRALWTLHTIGGLDARTAIENLKSPDEWIRAWTIQLVFESQENLRRLIQQANEQGLEADPDLNQLAESDPSPLVRLFIASAAQRSRSEEFRAGLVQRLLARSEDAGDHNLPLMIWYAMEPLVSERPRDSLNAALETKLPKILNFTTRRIASMGTSEARDLIAEKLATVEDAGRQLDMLHGLAAALRGQRSVPMPKGWEAIEARLGATANPDLRTLVQALSLTFGSQNALAALRKTLTDASAPAASRRAALDSLAGIKDPELPPALRALLRDTALRGPALRALAGYNDPNIPDAILGAYDQFDPAQKRDALNTLASRAAFAKPLLQALAEGRLSKKDLTADIVRQLRALKDTDIQGQMTRLYGSAREVTADKQAEIERYRAIYRRGGSQPGDASRGRAVYTQVCAQCHTLFDSGGQVGPDITGANRTDLTYLLETIVDPNAVIPNEYRTTEIETKDDRSLTGIMKSQDDKALVLQTANELLTIPRNDIASQRQTELSMMPEGLLEPLSEQEVRDLIYYLSRLGQVPLPAESKAP